MSKLPVGPGLEEVLNNLSTDRIKQIIKDNEYWCKTGVVGEVTELRALAQQLRSDYLRYGYNQISTVMRDIALEAYRVFALRYIDLL